MNNNHLTGIGGLALMALLLGFSSINTGRTFVRAGSSTSISASISLQALEKQLPAGDNISFLLYPLKRTSNPQRHDFDLTVFILDSKGQEIPMNGSPGEATFRKESANYISYLHHRAIPQEQIPQTYQLTLSSSKISLHSALNIHITLPSAAGSNTAYLTGTRSFHSRLKDSLPPRQLDSVPLGKCPPCTGVLLVASHPTWHTTWIQSLISKEYHKP